MLGAYQTVTLAYDDAVGWPFFRRVRARFERLARRHRMRFCSAADVGCGTGLFAAYLRRRWRVPLVFAIDNAPAMLRAASRRCTGLGVRFLLQDARRLALPRPVGLITAHFDMLNHLTGPGDLAQAVQSAFANLHSGGWFYFDLVTPCAPLGGFDAVRRRVRTRDGLLFEQRAFWQPRTRRIAVHASVATANRGGCACSAETHEERAYGPREIGRALLDAGFVLRGVYDEATLRAPGHCPARLVITAQRPN